MTRALLLASALAALFAASSAISAARAGTFDPASFRPDEVTPEVRAYTLRITSRQFREGCRQWLDGAPEPAGFNDRSIGWRMCKGTAWGETVNRSAGCYPNCAAPRYWRRGWR